MLQESDDSLDMLIEKDNELGTQKGLVRGGTLNLAEEVQIQNFMLVVGGGPGKGVKVDTNIIKDTVSKQEQKSHLQPCSLHRRFPKPVDVALMNFLSEMLKAKIRIANSSKN